MTSIAPNAARPGHDAFDYWRRLDSATRFDRVETLQQENARSVFRLSSSRIGEANASPATLIAKRAPEADIRKESEFYLRLLPDSRIRALRVFGTLPDDDRRYRWLFLEDAGERRYAPADREHRRLAAEWLAELHLSSADRTPAAGLEERGPAYYFPFIRRTRDTIEIHGSSAALDERDRAVLEEIADACLVLASHWDALADFCAAMPATLVHGDFKEDNLRLGGDAVPALLVFDWHEGGWGTPALDLAKFLGYRVAPDFATYLERWQARWPDSGPGEVRRLGYVGEIFRWLASVGWHADDLRYGCFERAVARMRVYRDWWHDIERAAPWRHNPALDAAGWQPLPRTWV